MPSCTHNRFMWGKTVYNISFTKLHGDTRGKWMLVVGKVYGARTAYAWKEIQVFKKIELSEQITYGTLGSRPPNNPIPRSSATEIPVAAPALTTTITDDSMRPTMGDLKAKQYSQSLVCSDVGYVKMRMVKMCYRWDLMVWWSHYGISFGLISKVEIGTYVKTQELFKTLYSLQSLQSQTIIEACTDATLVVGHTSGCLTSLLRLRTVSLTCT